LKWWWHRRRSWPAGDKAGVDVMITIFCDFRQISAKKFWGTFLKNQCYGPIFGLFCFVSSQNRHFFDEIFLKLKKSVPATTSRL
jgi:hypothetical protein